jgi:hypothetical protein
MPSHADVRRAASALSDAARLPLGPLQSHSQVGQTPTKSAADGGLLFVDVASVVTSGHVSWTIRRATTLRGEQFLHGIGHTDQNHPEVQQWSHEGQTRRFLAPVQTAG